MMTTMIETRRLAPAVRRLGPADRAAIEAHFVALDAADRALRFGVAADDEAIARYVDAIDFEHGAVLGAVTAAGTLAGVAHLALHHSMAELGLSVLPAHRQDGVGSALAAAALREAERLQATELRLHFAATNRGMRRIAEGLDMRLVGEGSDVTARRRLGRAAVHGTPIAAAL
jgi:GNAT superfamily N-acetyltransferase